MTIIIDTGLPDVNDVAKALKKLKVDFKVSAQELLINKAKKIIIPGSGSTKPVMYKLTLLNLTNLLRLLKVPILGIDIGMRLFCEKVDEKNIAGLGYLLTSTQKILKQDKNNWGKIKIIKNCILFKGVTNFNFYFKPSDYYVPVIEETVAVTLKDKEISAAIQKGNLFGVQFSPEKSGEQGLQVLNNFLNL